MADKHLCAFEVCNSGWVMASGCTGGMDCQNDTYYELFDSSMNLITLNDDRCGLCSEVQFKYAETTCSTFYLLQSCYQDTACVGHTKIYNGVVIGNPTPQPSVIPTSLPTRAPVTVVPPTTSPTTFSHGNSNSTRQREILVEFRRALNDPVNPWKHKINHYWGSDMPLYDWLGISVDDNGDIVSIKLNDQNLYGTIPDSIGELTTLKTLILSYNSILGPIPASIANLTNLEVLDLDYNFMTGTMPEFTKPMPYLQEIHLSFNYFSGSIANLANVNHLSSVTLLEAFNNRFTGAIPSTFCAMPLETMLLFGNVFTCYEPCISTSGGILDYLSTDDYPVCRGGYQDIALCKLGGSTGVNTALRGGQANLFERSVPDRILANVTKDIYFHSNMKASSYIVEFDDSVLLADLAYINPFFSYYFELNIFTSLDGHIYDHNYHYTLPNFPGVSGTPAFVSTLPFMRIVVTVFFDDFFATDSNLQVPGYSFSVIETLPQNLQNWDCDSTAPTINNPCDWYGKYRKQMILIEHPF